MVLKQNSAVIVDFTDKLFMGWVREEGPSVSDENQKTLPKMDDFRNRPIYLFLTFSYF